MSQSTAIRVTEIDSREMPTFFAHLQKNQAAITPALPEARRESFQRWLEAGKKLDVAVSDLVVRAGKLNYVVDWGFSGYAQVLDGTVQALRGGDLVALTPAEEQLAKDAAVLRGHFIGADLKFLTWDNFDQFRACRQRVLRLDSRPEGRSETVRELANMLGHTVYIARIERSVDAFGRALGVGESIDGLDRQLAAWQTGLRRLLTTIEDQRDDNDRVPDALQRHVIEPYLAALERQRERRAKRPSEPTTAPDISAPATS